MNEDGRVYKDALRVTLVMLAMCLIEVGVFALFKHFSKDVIIGALYGWAFSSANFFYLAFCVKKSVGKGEKRAKAYMSMSYTSRMILTAIMIVVAAKVDAINIWSAIIPLAFVRVAIYIIKFLDKKRGDNS